MTLTNNLSGGANDLTATFTWNPASQIASTVRTGDAYGFTGHANGSTAYTQNGLNQQINIGGSTASWDSKGNLTADPTTGKGYGYSSENLLTSSTGGTAASLAYDPALRLYQVAGSATTRFGYDGVDAIAEYDGSSNLMRRYVYDPTTGQPVVQYEGTGTASPRYLGADERGSIVSATDGAGALLGINAYDEYGRPSASNVGRFQYTGQKWIGELGAYDYKARDYLQNIGIFSQTDPIGYADGANLYAYVLGDPVNFVDPLGLKKMLNNCPQGPEIVICGERPKADPSATFNMGPTSGGGPVAGSGGGGGKTAKPTRPRPTNEHWACGLIDGTVKCKKVTDEYLCSGASKRLNFVGYLLGGKAVLGKRPTFSSILTTGAAGMMEDILFVEAGLDVLDTLLFC